MSDIVLVAIISVLGGLFNILLKYYLDKWKEKRRADEIIEVETPKDKKLPKWFRVFFTFIIGLVTGLIIGLIIVYCIKNNDECKPEFSRKAPYPITDDYVPSGFMGERSAIDINVTYLIKGDEARHGEDDNRCIRISYQPLNPDTFAGIYWQYPVNNWGSEPGLKINGASELTFWARGETGNELVHFKSGGIRDPNLPCHGIYERWKRNVLLDANWTQYRIDLTDTDMSCVIGAFAWVAEAEANSDGLIFYLDNIRFE